ncbi:MAG: hypothetical protein IJI68_02670 [Eggerthellaceae bacterium]|nr:hypothetical protein [Eggerthellaceae bacterium]
MKIEETTIGQIAWDGLTWEDFGGREAAIAAWREDGRADRDSARKAAFLDDREGGRVIEDDEIRKIDVYSLKLTDFARIGLANADPEPGEIGGPLWYDRTYGDMSVIVEVMWGVAAAYLKDYNFGYVKPLGECIYDAWGEECETPEYDPLELLTQRVIPEIELDILNGKIDLAQELYDYYHVLPAADNPFIRRRIDPADFMSVAEASEALGVSGARVKKMAIDRVIGGFKRDGKLWLSRDEVQERIDYIAEHGKPTRCKGPKKDDDR